MSGYVIPACSTLVLLFSPLNLFRTYPYPDSAVKESDSFFFFFFQLLLFFQTCYFTWFHFGSLLISSFISLSILIILMLNFLSICSNNFASDGNC